MSRRSTVGQLTEGSQLVNERIAAQMKDEIVSSIASVKRRKVVEIDSEYSSNYEVVTCHCVIDELL